jgi:acyl transferase domain-containing protein/acyl carrier protein
MESLPVNQEVDRSELGDTIAIIGMASRLPGAPNLKAFWELLCEGKEGIVHFSKDELLAAGVPEEVIEDPAFRSAKGYLPDVELFDAAFFGISPREAELMDPQHRVMMEVAWEAMEHAGYEPSSYPGRVAIFTSAGMNTYLAFNIMTHLGLIEEVGGFQLSMYNDKDFVPTRIAYSMNTHGPAIDIGTACSSSLVGIHMGCQHLLSYQSDMVLVGGVTVHFPQQTGYLHEAGSAYSPDGHCRPFDATVSGLVDGNGATAVILKRLTDAIADGDHIHAIVRGSAINNDGSDKIGYSAPSIDGQAEVILEAQAAASVHPDDISYVEAHGTATPLGDPIEVAALTQAFRSGTERKTYCGLGSVKSNIGHVDKAAGMAGLIKIVLSLQNEQLAPSLRFEAPNPKLNLPNTPFYVVNKLQSWPRVEGTPRIAGISSFGVGGTNSHAILQEAPPKVGGSDSRLSQLLVLSAKTESALTAQARQLSHYLTEHPMASLPDVAATLQRGRKRFAHRLAIVCSSAQEAVTRLEHAAHTYADRSSSGRVTFMFTGQGSQYATMGKALYYTEPTFKLHLDRCADALLPLLGKDIRDAILCEDSAREQAQEWLRQTELAQPALFSIEYALAKLWMSWGVTPNAMIGHSLGEYVAACLAGVFSLEDGLKLVSARSRLMQSMPTGSMLAVSLSEARVRETLVGAQSKLDIAAVNAANLCVVSGPTDAIQSYQTALQAQSIQTRPLHTSHAFHSAMMEPMLEAFAAVLDSVTLRHPSIRYVSNVTGTWMTDAQATSAQYWLDHIRQGVKFHSGLQAVLEQFPTDILLEIGPGRTLTSLARMTQVSTGEPPVCVPTLPPVEASSPADQFMLNSLGQLWMANCDIDWDGFYANEQRLRVPLPTYPFERSKFWIEPRLNQSADHVSLENAARRGQPKDWFYVPDWKNTAPLNPEATPSPRRCVIVHSTCALSVALEQTLVANGHIVTMQTLESLSAATFESTDVVLMIDDSFAHLNETEQDHAQTLGLFNLRPALAVLRALAGTKPDSPVTLCVITQDALSLSADSQIDPAQTAMTGLLKTIPYEHPHIRTQLIDVSQHQQKRQFTRIAKAIYHEAFALQPSEIVALRQGARSIPQLRALTIPTTTNEQASGAPADLTLLRQGGGYIILDGLTDIGMVFVQSLAHCTEAKLILTTSQALTPALTGKYQTSLAVLAKKGVHITLKEVNTSSPQELEQLTTQTLATWGHVEGIVDASDMHATKPNGVCATIEWSTVESYLKQQQQRMQVLERATEKLSLDFCMVMSSLSAQIGALGQAPHTIAGTYLQAYVQQLNQRSAFPWMIVQWDSWKAGETSSVAAERAKDFTISPSEGATAFAQLLQLGLVQCAVIATNPPMLRRAGILKQAGATEPEQTATERRYDRPNISNAFVAPRNEHEQSVAQSWQKFLAIHQVGVEDNFFDLGGHSLLGAQLTMELQQKFGVLVDIGLLFAHPTVAQLSAVLIERQMAQTDEAQLLAQLDKLETMTDEEVQALLVRDDLPPELARALGLDSET